VTNQGHDRSQLAPMALKAQEATGNKCPASAPMRQIG
jgi:hypothetical protein